MKEFNYNKYREFLDAHPYDAEAEAGRVVRRLAARGRSVKEIQRITQRDQAWIKAQLQKGDD